MGWKIEGCSFTGSIKSGSVMWTTTKLVQRVGWCSVDLLLCLSLSEIRYSSDVVPADDE